MTELIKIREKKFIARITWGKVYKEGDRQVKKDLYPPQLEIKQNKTETNP